MTGGCDWPVVINLVLDFFQLDLIQKWPSLISITHLNILPSDLKKRDSPMAIFFIFCHKFARLLRKQNKINFHRASAKISFGQTTKKGLYLRWPLGDKKP